MKAQAGVPDEARKILLISVPLTVALWLGLYRFLPLVGGMAHPIARLGTALVWISISGLFCLGAGIEAVAHERLRSTAFDPLAGRDSPRMAVNQRYLQNTLEQFALFAPGLAGLAWYSDNAVAMRAVPATALVWIVTRYAFWIGYHRGAAYRAAGVPGLIIPVALLLYVAARFGYELDGWRGAAVPIVLYLGLEVVLFRATRPIPA